MKSNSRSLLLLLYPTSASQDLFVTTKKARFLLPDMTAGGVRSLLHYLEKENYLSSERLVSETRYYLTEAGKRKLEQLFPALDPEWASYDGTWHCIVFQTAPKGDPQFRYLRSQVIKEKALQLSRGVKCVPRAFSDDFVSLCSKIYAQSVALFSVSKWELGFERGVITRKLALSDIATTYSGVSSEIDELLASREQKRTLTDQQKKQFLSVFDRFRDVLAEDGGVISYYYPTVPTATQILAQLQRALSKI